jgi:hypothetical protein
MAINWEKSFKKVSMRAINAERERKKAHNLIEKLAKYTGDVVGIMRKVAEVVGDDDGPTADYGPAFCQLNRDGQRLLDEAGIYLGEPTP